MAKLLLLDDDQPTLDWMKAAFASRGHEVQGFTTGRAALEAIPAFQPDLIVADILMPEMDGLAFAKLVRRHRVPVMFVSIAHAREAEAVLAGALGFVRKPATAAEIREAVEGVLGRRDRPPTILVVDDDPDVRELYRVFLEQRFVVLTAEHGQEALEVLRREAVDLAIIDVHMPVMNGAELVRAIRGDRRLERLPVIIQTSDPTALEAPVWGTLHVAQLLDKKSFVSWFERQVEGNTSLDERSRRALVSAAPSLRPP